MNTTATLETIASCVDQKSSEDWLTPRRFAIALAALLAALFPTVLAGSQSFVFRDFGIFGYPIAFYHRECFWRGEIPLWNPLNNCGIPFLAQWNTLTLYPPSLIYLLLPLPWSLNLFSILHLFLGGLGMFYLALRWTTCRAAAAIAALSFALSGVLTVSLTWPSCIAVLGWLPWVVLAVEQGWRLGGTKLWIAVLVGGVQMLAGMPEFILLTWVVIAGLWVLDAPSWVTFRRLLAIVALVACLAAAQLLPFLELLAHSRRQAMFDSSSWAMPLSGWANFLAPLLHTRPVPQGVYMSDAQPWLTSYYVAIPALLLALYSVFAVRDRRVYFFAGFTLLALWLALGKAGYLYQWLLNICPFVGAMRYPVKFVVVASIAIPILAAFGFAQWSNSPQRASPRQWQLIAPAVALFALTVMALVHARLSPTPNADWSGAFANAIWRLFFLGCSVVLLLSWRSRVLRGSPGRRLVFLGLLFAIVTVDSISHAPRYPTAPAKVFTPGALAARINAVPKPDRARAFVSRATHDLLYFGMLRDVTADFMGRRIGLFGNLNLIENIANVDGFYPLYLPAQREVGVRMFTARDLPSGLADFLGVSHVTGPGNVMQWSIRHDSPTLISAGQAAAFADRSSTMKRLLARDFDSRATVYLPGEAARAVATTNRTDATILNQKVEAQRLSIEVQASQPSLVVIANAYYKPWRAFVDDQPTRIWRANHAFQAVQVPAGRHRLTLRYIDWSFRIGCAVSICALALSVGALAYGWRRARQVPSPTVLIS